MRGLFIFLIACGPETKTDTAESTEPSSEYEDTGAEPSSETASEPSNEPSNEPSDEPAPLILDEGSWSLSTPNLVSDSCGVDNYQDVSEFVPNSITIDNSTENGFVLKPDNLQCERQGLEYTCDSLSLSESALLGSATMEIVNEISGTIISDNQLDMVFDVTIESCDGIGCLAIEAALSFPCPVRLTTSGTR
ncbi:MAG: hypothetical protein CMK59_15375 [Proteobacteria bacterium]|nr:hypothetical protein [Pseudomonadota bacterium]